MSRHRITVYNPLPTNDDVIQAVTDEGITLNDALLPELEIEHKVTVAVPKSIGEVRVLVLLAPSSFFGYHHPRGVSVYARPSVKDGFAEELARFLHSVGLAVDLKAFTVSRGQYMYYQEEVPDLTLERLRVEQFPNTTNIDVYWGDKLVVKQVHPATTAHIPAVPDEYTEVGVFGIDGPITTPDDVVLAGLRAVYEDGEHELHKTLFHIKPRHRRLTSSARVALEQNGLHPTLTFDLGPVDVGDADVNALTCSYFAYLPLGKSVFLDRNQLGANTTLLVQTGATDLEAPAYAVDAWGQEALLQLDGPTALTLHSRYNQPGNGSFAASLSPQVFVACDVLQDEEYYLGISPFDNKLNVGGAYENHFTNNTVFYHPLPTPPLNVSIPVGDALLAGTVAWVTFVGLVLGLVLIVRRLPRTSRAKKEQ